MGLQNATATRISTGVVRTTHVTGVLTDLGLDIAHYVASFPSRWRAHAGTAPVRRTIALLREPAAQRLALLTLVIGGFALGACLGTLAHQYLARGAFIPPVLFLSLLIWQDVKRPIAEIAPAEVVDAEPGFALPEGLSLYYLHKDRARQGKLHRMPNLLAWLDNLPESDRVVILDLGRDADMDRNAAIELGRLILRARQEGKKIILAGLSGEHARQVRQTNRDLIQYGDLCPDVDLALAHAIIHLEDWEFSAETMS
jgi:anti-anti-sigma regulatory factor